MKNIISIILLIIFILSSYFLYNNYTRFKQLSGIRSNKEINSVINLLDENYLNYYSLPENENDLVRIGDAKENHDVKLSEDILEYLNANRNKWQYEYIKNPVLATSQDDYTLLHFENEDDKLNTFFYKHTRFYNHWKYYLVTKNYNPIIENYVETLNNKPESLPENLWNNALKSLNNYHIKRDTMTYDIYINILFHKKTIIYPNNILDESSTFTLSRNIINLGEIHYYRQYISSINRDVTNLKSLWGNYKNNFYSFLSKTRYTKLVKPLIHNLLNTYDIVTQTNAYKKHFKDYNVSDDVFFALPNTQQFSENNSWSYSFWDRRFTEGNMELVHSILLEIKRHYE